MMATGTTTSRRAAPGVECVCGIGVTIRQPLKGKNQLDISGRGLAVFVHESPASLQNQGELVGRFEKQGAPLHPFPRCCRTGGRRAEGNVEFLAEREDFLN